MNFEIKVNEQISLKLRHPEDAEAIFVLTDKNREYLCQWLPWVDATVSSENTKNYIEAQLEAFKNKTGADFGVCHN